MSGLAHYFESEGLATVVVALVREHAEAMRPPRALWVPYELGRPFGAPGDAPAQRHVLESALALLDQPASAPLLVDLDHSDAATGADPDWHSPSTGEPADALAETRNLMPLWQRARERIGKTTVGVSGLEPEVAIEYIARYLSDDPLPNPRGMAPVSRLRFAIDDIKAFYTEAALAEGGRPSSAQLREWLWEHTLAGAMLLDFQDRARHSDDKPLRTVSGSLIPAERTLSYRRAHPDS